MLPGPPACGAFGLPRATASANTKIVSIIPPWTAPGSNNNPFTVDPSQTDGNGVTGVGPWLGNPSGAWTHITDLFYTSLTTAHSLYILRPLNWTYTTAAVGSNTTAITLAADPGLFATKFKYPLPSGKLPNQANNVIAAGDYVAYQWNDGTWHADLVASGSGTAPVLTTGTPSVAGAGINQYAPVFWYGAVGVTDPNTGMNQPLTDSVAASVATRQTYGYGLWSSLHRGDPLIFVSSNGTDAGILEVLAGYYCNQF